MDVSTHLLQAAHELSARADASTESRPAVYKVIGICLAVASGLFIGISFVLKKIGLLKANQKYNEEAGEGYGYLKNAFWWTGMTLMIMGEICNFVAYAFVDAILVTPLGALSVVITTVLSAIFLKERLSLVGKIGCFLCIVGSVIIPLNAPTESSAATIQEMQHFVIQPGFLSYAGVIIVGSIFTALWAGPRYGKKTMMVYLTICSNIGGLSVVATQGLGAAIIAQIGGTPQFNQWFLYVLLVFVIGTLLTEIIYLNKALNLFNAAMVTPTYYVYFTSCTIVTSAILFQGFKGTVDSIITVVMGFFVICSGVVLLQLSKSAKDVPDAAVFSGDLDQVRTIAEQEQPESEPKADAIRGTAAIVRRLSTVRQKKEIDEAKRLHEEKQMDLEPIGEDEQIIWDGLRRRRTATLSSRPSRLGTPRTPSQHFPLGMSHFPDADDHDEEDRPTTAGFWNQLGSVRSRSRTTPSNIRDFAPGAPGNTQSSPMHPVPLTEIALPYKGDEMENSPYGLPKNSDTAYNGSQSEPHIRFVDGTWEHAGEGVPPPPPPHSAKRQFSFTNVFRKGSPASTEDHLSTRSPRPRLGTGGSRSYHSTTSKGSRGATEEERLGLVKGDSNVTLSQVPPIEESSDDDDRWSNDGKDKHPYIATATSSPERYGRGITGSPDRYPFPRQNVEKEADTGYNQRYADDNSDRERRDYEGHRQNWSQSSTPPRKPPPSKDGKGQGGGAFI